VPPARRSLILCARDRHPKGRGTGPVRAAQRARSAYADAPDSRIRLLFRPAVKLIAQFGPFAQRVIGPTPEGFVINMFNDEIHPRPGVDIWFAWCEFDIMCLLDETKQTKFFAIAPESGTAAQAAE
jgi:hypothetical protein